MDYSPDSAIDRVNQWIRSSISLRITTIAILILLLLIPISMIRSLIRERENLRERVVEELIGSQAVAGPNLAVPFNESPRPQAGQELIGKWSGSQTIAGPILSVPYKTYFKTDEGDRVERLGYAYFLPDQLSVTGQITPEVRYRSIYEVVVYSVHLALAGRFAPPDFAAFDIAPEHILWEDAVVVVGISDLRGIREAVVLDWGGQEYTFGPGVAKDLFKAGVTVRLGLGPERLRQPDLPFSFDLELDGSRSLHFVPLGKETRVEIGSTWADPSFDGAFLPDKRSVDANGFSAAWQVLHLNRNYPQQWLGDQFNVFASSFGVRLLVPVDTYQKSMRSAKYAVLFISLTFLTFFFIEITNSKRIHPIQYIMVGFALSIFYVLLLAISEHLSFNTAFILASLATISLITLYSVVLFKNRRLTLFIGLMLALMYGFIYTLLQLQDYALLIGSLGLFGVLAAFMYLSRKIDWYAPSKG